MKTPCHAFFAAVLIVLVGASTANSQTVEWARQLGTEGIDLGSDVSVDGMGNVFVSGYSVLGLDDTNPDAAGAFVSKFDTQGNLNWTRHLETHISAESYYGLSADGKGNVYISGINSTSGRGGDYSFLSKLDTDGNLNWTRTIKGAANSSGDYSFLSGGGRANVFADGRGSIYLSGSIWGSLDGESVGGVDAFMSKFDEEGNLAWNRQLGSIADDHSFGISADELGNVFISGITKGDLDGPNAGGIDAFISKFDADGNINWTRQLGTPSGDRSYGVTADGGGNVFISGWTGGSLDGANAGLVDAFVSKYDEDGILSWTRQFGASRDDVSYGVASDGQGKVFISGITGNELINSEDAFVRKYDEEGNLVWTRQVGSSNYDVSRGISVDGMGSIFITGFTEGDLGGTNAGLQDAFLVKINDETFVPEPSSLLLVLSAMAVFAGRRRVG